MFTTKNSTIRVNNENDVHKIISFLRGFSLKNSDEKNAHEVLCICIYVAALFKIKRLRLPITIKKDESPDFRIFLDGDKEPIGLEHTRATLEQYKMADSEFKKMPEGSMMEPLFYSPFKKLPKKDVNIGIRNPDEKLKGLPSAGNSIEIEWAATIKDAIVEKTNLLNQDHFQKFPTNELLIEDDSPTELFKEKAIAFDLLNGMKKEIDQEKGIQTFNKIHVFTINDLIYDFFNERLTIDMSKKKLPSTLND